MKIRTKFTINMVVFVTVAAWLGVEQASLYLADEARALLNIYLP